VIGPQRARALHGVFSFRIVLPPGNCNSDRVKERNMKRAVFLLALIPLAMVLPAFAGESKEFKKGTLDHWDMLQTGTSCQTTDGILTGMTSHCGSTGARVYHVLSEDGFDYTVQPDTWDPLKTIPLGQEIKYRIDQKGWFWTPDPKNGQCPWPCTGKQRKDWKQSGDPNHEAKYFVSLVEKRKVDSSLSLTNKDIIELSHLGLSEALVIQKINTSKAAFDVSISALKSLKDDGVSDAVIAAMMQRQSQN
jgi:hypothetical protein